MILLSGVAEAKFLQLDLAVDVKSRFSDGCFTLPELSTLAQKKKLDGLILGDHDVKTLEFGFWPFEHLLRKKDRQTSLLSSGVSEYLQQLKQTNTDNKDLLLIGGVESAPFYYWTGNPFQKDLVAHNWDKHLLLVGFSQARDYEQLPVLHGNLSFRYVDRYLTLFLAFCGLALVGLWLIIRKKFAKTGWVLMLVSLLMGLNNHPFRSSAFSAYNQDPGIAPYQEVIDYAAEKGALVFWNHLEWPTAMGKGGTSMKLDTPPHPKDLLTTYGYTGFQAVGDKPVASVQAGREWDRLLKEYQEGRREWPMWGVGTADYHCESADSPSLGAVRTVVLVRSRDPISIQDALRTGRMYSVKQSQPASRLSLDEFSLADLSSGQKVAMGEELVTEGAPNLEFHVRSTGGLETQATMTLIRDGGVIRQVPIKLPYEFRWQDQEVARKGMHYYRLLVESGSGNRLVSNPVFVRFGKAGPQVASAPPPSPAPPRAATPPPATPKSPKPPAITAPAPPKEKKVAAPAPAVAQKPAPPAPTAAPPAPVAKAPQPVPPPPKPVVVPKQVEALINGLTLYGKPSVRAPVIGKVKKGEKMILVQKTDVQLNHKSWLKVEREGKTAYVWEGFVKD